MAALGHNEINAMSVPQCRYNLRVMNVIYTSDLKRLLKKRHYGFDIAFII